MKTASDFLEDLLTQGSVKIGQIIIMPDYSLRHITDKDLSSEKLKSYEYPESARQIARYDEERKYRSLKTASNLIRGWRLCLSDLEEVIQALDFFYPAALNLWISFLEGTLVTTPLRETLNRQTGMYRITQLLRDDQAEELACSFCSSEMKCLRKTLWSISREREHTPLSVEQLKATEKSSSEIPLLCREACNLLVAAARPIAKKNLPPSSDG